MATRRPKSYARLRLLAFDESALQIAIAIMERSPYRADREQAKAGIKRLGLWPEYLARVSKKQRIRDL